MHLFGLRPSRSIALVFWPPSGWWPPLLTRGRWEVGFQGDQKRVKKNNAKNIYILRQFAPKIDKKTWWLRHQDCIAHSGWPTQTLPTEDAAPRVPTAERLSCPRARPSGAQQPDIHYHPRGRSSAIEQPSAAIVQSLLRSRSEYFFSDPMNGPSGRNPRPPGKK